MPTIFDLDIHPIPSACEYHYDIRYLLQAPKDAQLIVGPESIDLAWVAHHDLAAQSTAHSIQRMHEKFKNLLSQQKKTEKHRSNNLNT